MSSDELVLGPAHFDPATLVSLAQDQTGGQIVKFVAAKILDATHLELREAISAPAGESIEIALPESVAPAGRRRTGSRPRQIEQEWRRTHQDVLSRYAGQWVVLEGEEIVAHGEDPARLVELARDEGVDVPYVFYVDSPRPRIVMSPGGAR